MGSMSEIIGFDLPGEFFAPVSSDMIDGLIAQYSAMRKRVDEVSDIMVGEIAGAVSYFFEGNGRDSRYGSPSVERIFEKKGAVAALNSAYWSKAMHLTDVLNYMPQARRDEWNKSITEYTCPEFEEHTVRTTLMNLLNMRSKFLAERVDGIFRGLSGEHVTNSPAGFGKRMIVAYVLNDYCGYSSSSKCGLINDLRCVIAKFMGRDEPGYSASEGLIRSLKHNYGQWVSIDGGALKIRLYMKGTAHIEVHPDMAWRLNATLANLYPMAIPPEFRQKPKRKLKEFEMIQRPLPFAVINVLASMKQAQRAIKQEGDWRNQYRFENIENALKFDHYGDVSKHVIAEAKSVLESIGGAYCDEGWYQFDYSPNDVIEEIVASGCIPDQKAHQFYPTPENIAIAAVELAAEGATPEMLWLEPSAGQGGLADHLPKDRTTCVEINALNAKVLELKGFNVTCGDFLQFSGKFDRIVMNPPFSEGRWQAHISHASTLLNKGGRLVAVLPASAQGKDVLPGFNLTWSREYANEFAGTSVSVVIMTSEAA